MAFYRVYYCDAAGKIFSANDLEASDDTEAVARGKQLAGTRFLEVWERDRLVHRPETAPRSAGERPPRLGRAPSGGFG